MTRACQTGNTTKHASTLLLLVVLALSTGAFAQFTTVSGTVTDPNGLPYAFGTIASTIVASGTPTLTIGGVTTNYLQPSQATGLDKTGKFIVRLADNTQVSPGGSTWSFTVCSAVGTVQPAFGKGPVCFTVTGVTISGASQDITTTLNAAALALTANFGGSGCGSGTLNTLMIFTGATTCGNSTITFTAGTPNLYTTPDSFLVGTTFTTGGTTPQIPLVVQQFPQFSGTGGGSLTGASIIATNTTAANANTTVSSITGAFIEASGGSSNPGQTATLGNMFGVNVLAQAPALTTTVTNLRSGFFQLNAGTGGATITNAHAVEGFISGTSGTITTAAGLYVKSPTVGPGTTFTHNYGLFIEDQTVQGSGTNSDPHGIFVAGGGVQVAVHTFSTLPTCNAAAEGRMEAVSDATSATNGATVVGSGAHHVLAYCNSVNWLVVVGT